MTKHCDTLSVICFGTKFWSSLLFTLFHLCCGVVLILSLSLLSFSLVSSVFFLPILKSDHQHTFWLVNWCLITASNVKYSTLWGVKDNSSSRGRKCTQGQEVAVSKNKSQLRAWPEFYVLESNHEAIFSRVCSQCVDSDLITKRSADVRT